ncbi:hypothetical protein NQ318_019896 [Aromia moschata]|uniref:Uncharacterized protein n=1 Tax=Aromia moschata TaxID=1265417 RepID=A0AAV8XHU7_9CUCU|nr:hypothetical protein NQ318_019896 [Aromia moschata]
MFWWESKKEDAKEDLMETNDSRWAKKGSSILRKASESPPIGWRSIGHPQCVSPTSRAFKYVKSDRHLSSVPELLKHSKSATMLFRIIVFIVLVFNAGMQALGDETNSSPESKTAVKSGIPLKYSEKVDDLAEKVLLIHGVQLGVQTEENFENAQKLRLLVADVEKQLAMKLVEMGIARK